MMMHLAYLHGEGLLFEQLLKGAAMVAVALLVIAVIIQEMRK